MIIFSIFLVSALCLQDVASDFGLAYDGVMSWGDGWDDATRLKHEKRICDLIEDGMTYADIRRKYKYRVTESTISRIAKRHGVQSKNVGRRHTGLYVKPAPDERDIIPLKPRVAATPAEKGTSEATLKKKFKEEKKLGIADHNKISELQITPAKKLDYDIALEGIETSLSSLEQLDSTELIEQTAKRALVEANKALTLRPDNAAVAAHVATVMSKIKPILQPSDGQVDWDQQKVMELWNA